jgi:hypothetical protein
MGKRKSTQENRPIYEGQILGAADQAQQAYAQAQPMIAQTSQSLGNVSQDLFNRYAQGGDPATQAASNYIVETLGNNQAGNPYLDQMVADTSDSLQRRIQTQLGTRGGIGGSAERNIVASQLADAELGLRFNDFDRRRQLQAGAAQMAPGISAAGYLPAQMGAQFGTQAAMLPLQGSAANAGTIGGLLGQYQNQKTTQSGGLLESILGGAFQLGSAALMGCDIRIKENIVPVGHTPKGVPLYRFDYIGGAKGIVGPMAQEVAIMQPEALGPVLGGYMTVDVGALR